MRHRRQRILLAGVGRCWRVVLAMPILMAESRYVRKHFLQKPPSSRRRVGRGDCVIGYAELLGNYILE